MAVGRAHCDKRRWPMEEESSELEPIIEQGRRHLVADGNIKRDGQILTGRNQPNAENGGEKSEIIVESR